MSPDGPKIRLLRLSRGWNQDDLATSSETTVRTIQRIEAGSPVRMDTLKAVASALQVDFDTVLAPNVCSAEQDAAREAVNAEFRKRNEAWRQLNQTLTELCDYWAERAPGGHLTAADRKDLEKWLGTFSVPQILEAIDVCTRQYLEILPNGLCTPNSAEIAFHKIPAVSKVNQASPQERELYLIRGFVRKRMSYFHDLCGIQLLKDAYAAGVSIEKLRAFASVVRNWSEFREGLEVLTAHPTVEFTVTAREPPTPSPEILQRLASTGIRTIAETVAIVAATKYLAPPAEVAAGILQEALRNGEFLITIDYDQGVYYFGRSRDGGGRTYGIEQPWTTRELADAIRNRLEFLL